MESVMISIQPKRCELIVNGKKTIEVRKTIPKLETPFKCYIYCTKPKDRYKLSGSISGFEDELYRLPDGTVKYGSSIELMSYDDYDENNFLNGKVIGEFVCSRIENFRAEGIVFTSEIVQKSCISVSDLVDYGNGNHLFAWKISDLKIYDKPKELVEFNHFTNTRQFNRQTNRFDKLSNFEKMKKSPQSWCYVEELE